MPQVPAGTSSESSTETAYIVEWIGSYGADRASGERIDLGIAPVRCAAPEKHAYERQYHQHKHGNTGTNAVILGHIGAYKREGAP